VKTLVLRNVHLSETPFVASTKALFTWALFTWAHFTKET
jgi:hypothetical protein